MCLAIYKPKGVSISKTYLYNGYVQNHDACGFAFANRGRIECYKGFPTFKAFWQAIKPLQGKYAMLIHFRFATHGDKNEANAHPILVNRGHIAVIHNGVIPIKCHGNDSDTVTFARDVLAPCFKNFSWNDATLRYLVETSIGSHNKIACLNSKGQFAIYNESSGHWHKGAWYSNNGYEGTSGWTKVSVYASETYASWRKGYEPKAYYKQTVFDEPDTDELDAEAIETYGCTNLSVPDKESSNSLDYDGTSQHSKPLIPLTYDTETHTYKKGNVVNE